MIRRNIQDDISDERRDRGLPLADSSEKILASEDSKSLSPEHQERVSKFLWGVDSGVEQISELEGPKHSG